MSLSILIERVYVKDRAPSTLCVHKSVGDWYLEDCAGLRV